MRQCVLTLVIFACGTLAHAQAPGRCFGLPCLQSPRLDFTVGKDYEQAPVFRGDAAIMPRYKRVQPVGPLSVTRQFFTLSPATLNLTRVAVSPLPGVVHAPIQPVLRSGQLPTVPAMGVAPPEPVNPNSGSFSTGVGMPSFTPGAPK